MANDQCRILICDRLLYTGINYVSIVYYYVLLFLYRSVHTVNYNTSKNNIRTYPSRRILISTDNGCSIFSNKELAGHQSNYSVNII